MDVKVHKNGLGHPRLKGIIAACSDSSPLKQSTLHLEKGKLLHGSIVQSGSISDSFAASLLVNMYAKLGCMAQAIQVFDGMDHRDVVSWTVVILGHAKRGEGQKALELFALMVLEGCLPDALAFVAAVKACSCLVSDVQAVDRGMAIHALAGKVTSPLDSRLANTLVAMYARVGRLKHAQTVFDSMQIHSSVSWNALILGYAENGGADMSLRLLGCMFSHGKQPDALTFVAALRSCAACSRKQVHCMAIHTNSVRLGYDGDIRLKNTLLNMYAKYGDMESAQRVFNEIGFCDCISWTALVFGYAENGEEQLALQHFSALVNDIWPLDALAFVAALAAACRTLANGMAIHALLPHNTDKRVSSILTHMYFKCGRVVEAQRTFNGIADHDVVSWTLLIQGYLDNGDARTALDMFWRVPQPNELTFVAALRACSMLVALEAGRAIHAQICRQGLNKVPKVATSLVDFYGRSGSMAHAQKVFDSLHPKDVVVWTALISGYGVQGDGQRALQLFADMQDQELLPNAACCLCVLNACSHAGLIDQGKECFEAMTTKYGIQPGAEHYTCVVDMLIRAGRVEESLNMLSSMPFVVDGSAWASLLARWKL